MLPPMSVPGVIVIVTGLFLGRVVSSPVVQEECNDLKPVVCPNYGMCCTADQFCSANSGTCESCFPEAITKREDRLKFCSDLEKKRTNSSMRHYTCKAACITLFNMTEIMSYVDKAPEKTAKELITDHNSSMHEHLEGSVVNRIDDNQRRLASLEDEVYSLKVAAILTPVLTFIAIIMGVAIKGFWRRRVSKKKEQTDERESKKLLDKDVEKKLSDAFDLSKNTSLFSSTWSPLETKFNEDVKQLTTRVESQEKLLQDTEEIFTKNNDELKAEVGRINALHQVLESTINETEKKLNDDVENKLINAFNLENKDSLFYQQWLPLQEKLYRAIDAYNTRVINQEKLLQNTEEKIKKNIEELKAEVERKSDISQQLLQSQFDELQKSVTKESAKLMDNDITTKIDDIHKNMKYFMRRIDDQEKLVLAEKNQREIEKSSMSSQHTKHKRSSSPIVEVDGMSLRGGCDDVEISNDK